MSTLTFKFPETHFSITIYSTLTLTMIILCLQVQTTFAQNGKLPGDEMDALLEIAEQLGKEDWNFTTGSEFSLNPCDENSNWATPRTADNPLYTNSVFCNCSFPDSVCHIQSISLEGQNLPGVLPPSLSKLSYLKNINLDFNYLNGTIPCEWVSNNFEVMSLAGNRLSGPIPECLGNISSLVYLNLESNMFEGMIPAELGKLSNLCNLILSANNLTGELPWQLKNLKKLTELRLSSNNFIGKLPSFESWRKLEQLELQASGFGGPLPSSLKVLTSLITLLINDLNGGGPSMFPDLTNLKNLSHLMLRSCNISGTIPEYLFNRANLQTLDLSFNNFEGEISNTVLPALNFMFLTNNSLTGPIPQWIRGRTDRGQIDLSYNNFNESSVPCRKNLNLFRSYRPNENSTGLLSNCLSPCSKDHYSFHVNCGGKDITIGKTLFEADEEVGAARFFPGIRNWGASSTGFFWGLGASSEYVTQNVSILRMKDSPLYMTARLSPLSLTYYGNCLGNGDYKVTLHFAEIVFSNNQSYQSLGRRLFDVYIQGERKERDFNIVEEAKGVGKPVKKYYSAKVTNKVLEIRFRYTGKGTTRIPTDGTYGPLISAISVKSAFRPGTKKMIIGIATSLVLFSLILGVIGFLFWNHYIGRRIAREQELRGLDLRKGFTYRQIKASTNDFDPKNKIGQGGFGSVYKGTLLDGRSIAVKQLSSKSKQGNQDFVNEIGMISALQHPNLVKLYGCCIKGNELLLVYEYMRNNSLARALFGPVEEQLEMDWPTRQRIFMDVANGLAFLHEESTLKIVHRDIKPDNILLDDSLNAKISDFGLAKLDANENNTHISTRRIAGTRGYMAPEYALWGHLTYKADVYSFGVVMLQIICGKNNMKHRLNGEFVSLFDWALGLHSNGRLMDLVDPKLGSDLNKSEVEKSMRVALLCMSPFPSIRPTISMVVSMLQGDISIQEQTIQENESNLQALMRQKCDYLYQDSEEIRLMTLSSGNREEICC